MKESTLTTAEVCKKFGISRSGLYCLRASGEVSFPTKHAHQYLWTRTDVEALQTALTKPTKAEVNKPKYNTTNINNRRYLGNKYRLLPFITRIVTENCPNIASVADIFAGTGAVSFAFSNKRLITNDIMYSNYICHLAWFGTETVDLEKIQKYNGKYEGALNTRENTRQIIPNKCTLIVNDDNSIDLTITGGNEYDDQLSISKEELTKVEDNLYKANKNSKNYTFDFYSDYMNLTIENTDNTITEGKLSKMN